MTHNPEPQSPSGASALPDAKKLIDMELVISRLLRLGVYTSSAVILAGVLMMIVTRSTGYSAVGSYHLATVMQYHAHTAGEFPVTVPEVIHGALLLKPFAVIMLGALLLIATPVMRVAVSLVAFVLEGDRAYAWITLYVLVVLLVSFLMGSALG
jgi:uncharacterized membrane protein